MKNTATRFLFSFFRSCYPRSSAVQKSFVRVRLRPIHLSVQRLIETIYSAAQMGNSYRASNYERDIKSIEKLRPRHSGGSALFDVISDAIVTAKHNRSHQTQQFFGAFVERTIFISLRIEREKSLDSEMVAAEQLFIHVRTITVEFIHTSPFAMGNALISILSCG
jgi:hypothetical protein